MRCYLFFATLSLLPMGAWAEEFVQVVEGRISSREWAGVVAVDLCRAFPERTREIVTAIGRERPEGAMTAAIAVARELPDRAGEAGEAVASLVQPELRSAAKTMVLDESKR